MEQNAHRAGIAASPDKHEYMAIGPDKVGRREQIKDGKRRRIRDAASDVFQECGYEKASVREIAKRAGVATGTVFLYAPDKRNLLLWVLNDELDAVTQHSFAELGETLPEDADLLEQLLAVFAARYRYWSRDPKLSLRALQELIAIGDSEASATEHLAFYYRRRNEMNARVAELVRAHQVRGKVRADIDPAIAGRLFVIIYNAGVRYWLRSTDPQLANGLAELRKLLKVALVGVLV